MAGPKNLDELAREMGRPDAAAAQAHLARRRRQRMTPGAAGTVAARQEGERWLADCPYCGGAELISRSTDFFCFSCGMAANGGHPAAVVWPAPAAGGD